VTKKIYLIFLSVLFLGVTLTQAATLNVVVKDEKSQPISGAVVAAIVFTAKGDPDPTNSKLDTTNASGQIALTIADNLVYVVLATKQGYSPTIRDQMMDPTWIPVQGTGTLSKEIILKSGLTGVGWVKASITLPNVAVLPQMILGDISNPYTREPVAFGAAILGTNPGDLYYYNVPLQSANVYKAHAFAPSINLSLGVDVGEIKEGVETTVNINLTGTDALPPSTVVQAVGVKKIAFEGIVQDINSKPVVGARIGVTRLEGGWWQTTTDDNGRYIFYGYPDDPGGLDVGTYFFDVTCNGYKGQRADNNKMGYSYDGQNTVYVSFTPKDGRALVPVTGIITGKVVMNISGQLQAVPQAWIHLRGDWSLWYGTDPNSTVGLALWENKAGMSEGHTQNRPDGTFSITGLPDGNYTVDVWTQFSQSGITYNRGKDGQDNYDPGSSTHTFTSDDLRVSIRGGNCEVYSSSGILLGNTVTVEIPPTEGATAEIKGKLVFPNVVDLSANPVTIIAHEDWQSFEQRREQGENATYTPYLSALANTIQLPQKYVYYIKGVWSGTSEGIEANNLLKTNFGWWNYETGEINFVSPLSPGSYFIVYSYQVNPKAGFIVINASGKQEYDFTINIPPGCNYQLRVLSNRYGLLREAGSDIEIDLRSVSSVTLPPFKMFSGGIIKGTVRLPNGQLFKPTSEKETNEKRIDIEVQGVSVQCGDRVEVSENGSFQTNALVPGIYRLKTQGKGPGYTYAQVTIDNVVVSDGKDTNVEIKLAEGIRCKPAIAGTLPTLTADYGLMIIGLDAGTVLDPTNFTKLIMFEPPIQFFYAYEDWNRDGQREWGWGTKDGETSVFLSAGKYDFYLMVGANSPETENGKQEMFVTFLTTSKNITIDKNFLTGPANAQYVPINITCPSLDKTGAITGKITGTNIFREQDVKIFAQNFMKFVEYIPAVTLTDANGVIRGLAIEIPIATTTALNAWENGAASGDVNKLKQAMINYPPAYWMKFLPAGEYTAVFTTPNYPLYVEKVSISADKTTTLDVDFDKTVGAGGTISGKVTAVATNNPIPNTSVTIASKVYKRIVYTDSNGDYSVAGLAKGIYRIEVYAEGYELAVAKKIVSDATVTANFALKAGGETLEGTVYYQKIPWAQPYPNAKIAAFNKTYNDAHPKEILPIYYAVSSSSGYYVLRGLVSGDDYKLFIIVPGKLVESATVKAGVVSGVDFVLKSILPAFDIRAKISGNNVNFIIKSLKTLSNYPAWGKSIIAKYVEGTSYTDTGAQSVILTVSTGTENTWICSVTSPDAEKTYVLRVSGYDGKDVGITDFVFSLKVKAYVVYRLDSFIAEGGEIALDETGEDSTSVEVFAGGVEITTTTVSSAPGIENVGTAGTGTLIAGPLLALSKQLRPTTGEAGVLAQGIASEIYQIELSNATMQKDLTLTLSYDKTKVVDTNRLLVCQYNETTRIWQPVSGTVTVDPLSGTVSVDISSLSSGGTSAPAGLSLGAISLLSTRAPGAGQAGKFAVFTSTPPTHISYTGDSVKVYNFPNPFNLKSKTVNLRDGGSLGTSKTTTGTVIKYCLPSAKSGNITFYIYNLAGELVRKINDGDRTGGWIYYAEWLGDNDKDENVASGVYFCIMKVKDEKVATFKMAVVK